MEIPRKTWSSESLGSSYGPEFGPGADFSNAFQILPNLTIWDIQCSVCLRFTTSTHSTVYTAYNLKVGYVIPPLHKKLDSAS